MGLVEESQNGIMGQCNHPTASVSWPVGCLRMAVRFLYRRSYADRVIGYRGIKSDVAYGEWNEKKPRKLG